MDNVYLIGTEAVTSAARVMQSAAHDMQNAAENFREIAQRLELALRDHADRIEATTQTTEPDSHGCFICGLCESDFNDRMALRQHIIDAHGATRRL